MKQHGQFEIMCALAAVGQLCDQDLEKLQRHMEDCAECQQRISDFARVSAQVLLPLVAPRGKCSIPRGMEARFAARALKEGILSSPQHRSEKRGPIDFVNFLGGLTAGLFLALVIVGAITKQLRSPKPMELSDSSFPSIQHRDVPLSALPVPAPLHIHHRTLTKVRKPAIQLPAAKSASYRSMLPVSLKMSGRRNRQIRDGITLNFRGVPSRPNLLRSLPVEGTSRLFFTASVQNPEQLDRFLTSAVEASPSKPVQRVFHYIPEADTSLNQLAYSHQNFDWHAYWFRADGPFLKSSTNSIP